MDPEYGFLWQILGSCRDNWGRGGGMVVPRFGQPQDFCFCCLQ